MGRWSQRRRSGGGPPTALIEMTQVNVFLFNDLDVDYSGQVDANDLDPGAFQSAPSDEFGQTAVNQTSTQVRIHFAAPINADDTLTYTGVTPGILTPQVIGF